MCCGCPWHQRRSEAGKGQPVFAGGLPPNDPSMRGSISTAMPPAHTKRKPRHSRDSGIVPPKGRGPDSSRQTAVNCDSGAHAGVALWPQERPACPCIAAKPRGRKRANEAGPKTASPGQRQSSARRFLKANDWQQTRPMPGDCPSIGRFIVANGFAFHQAVGVQHDDVGIIAAAYG